MSVVKKSKTCDASFLNCPAAAKPPDDEAASEAASSRRPSEADYGLRAEAPGRGVVDGHHGAEADDGGAEHGDDDIRGAEQRVHDGGPPG